MTTFLLSSESVSNPAGDSFRPPDTALGRRIERLERENARLRAELSQMATFRELAYRDALTGLWNRRLFEERLAEELERAERETSRGCSVIVADINDLKTINDTQGHAAGDRAIRAAGEYLQTSLRTYDVCCRIGGDEFAVLFPCQPPEAIAEIAERLRAGLARPDLHDALPFGLSLGLGGCPRDGQTAYDVLAAADVAMYQDKRQQRRG